MKRLFTLVIFGATAFALGQNPCSVSGSYFAERNACLAQFRDATAPSNLPKEGLFNADSWKQCFDDWKKKFSASKSKANECRKKEFSDFEKVSKICILKRWNEQACGAALASAVGDDGPDALQNSIGATLLLRAAENLNRQAFDFFLSKRADIHATDMNGKNVLMYALSESYPGDTADASLREYYGEKRRTQLALVNSILKAGVSPNEMALNGMNALDYALFVPGIDQVVDALLAADARPGVILSNTFKQGEKKVTKLNSTFLRTLDSLSPYATQIWKATKDWKAQLKQGAYDEAAFWQSAVQYYEQGLISEEMVVAALAKGISPNEVDSAGTSFYLYFMDGKKLASSKIAGAFQKAKVKMDELKWEGKPFSLLWSAILANDGKMLKFVLSTKPDLKKDVGHSITITSSNGKSYILPLTPLEAAVHEKKTEMVKMLIKAKAPVKESFALGIAVLNDDVEMAKILIAAKANVNDYFPDGETLIENAKSDAMTALLKKNGAVVPFHGSFVDYCRNSELSVKDVLAAFDGGADVNEVDNDGFTPLHMVAALSKDPKIVDVLVKRGAMVNAMTSNGWTPFLYAARQNANPAILTTLVRHGADVTLRPKNENNWDALFYAVANNPNPAVTATLLSMGLDENYSDRDKNTLILVAIQNNPNEKILLQLFKRGYKVNPENSWWDNPLEVAIKNQADIKIIKLLLQAHAKVTDDAMRAAQGLSVGKFRNQLLDLLIKAKKAQKR